MQTKRWASLGSSRRSGEPRAFAGQTAASARSRAPAIVGATIRTSEPFPRGNGGPGRQEQHWLAVHGILASVGFSMSFVRIRSGQQVDGDREGARRFLQARGLVTDSYHETSADLLYLDGEPLCFDGYRTDLHIDPPDTARTFSAGIWHATLTEQECDFIFDLCVAAGFLVCNHQGDPYFLVPAGNHDLADLEAAMDDPRPVFVESAAELREALSAGFRRFLDYRDRVVFGDVPPNPA